MSVDGLITRQSAFGHAETLERLTAALRKAGVTLFATIDHAQAAQGVGLQLPPTVLLVFGDPRAGTPLMASQRTVGIDLPLKALVWQSDDGRVWLSYNDPAWLAARHGVDAGMQPVVNRISNGLQRLAAGATGDDSAGG